MIKVTAELVIYADNDLAADLAIQAFLAPVKGATQHYIELSRTEYDGRAHT